MLIDLLRPLAGIAGRGPRETGRAIVILDGEIRKSVASFLSQSAAAATKKRRAHDTAAHVGDFRSINLLAIQAGK
jgi:hypothetical protein